MDGGSSSPSATLVVKIGGSLITHRGQPCAADPMHMSAIAETLASVVDDRLIVCHGLGSYGRAVLPLYSGSRIPAAQSRLARRVTSLLAELNEQMIDRLLGAGIPVSPLDAGTLFVFDGDAIVLTSVDVLARHLGAGRVPVVHGGTFQDLRGDYVIVSSDRMTFEIASAMRADRVVWATDVDGVLDRDRRVMPVLDRTLLARLWHPSSVAADPGGAMHGKVDMALRLADRGIQSRVVNGTHRAGLRSALSGAGPAGTRIGTRIVAAPPAPEELLIPTPPRADKEDEKQERARPYGAGTRKDVAMTSTAPGAPEPQDGRPYKESCMPLPELFHGPRVERLNYVVYPDNATALEALKRGDIDLLDYPIAADGAGLPDDIKVDACRDFGYYYVAFNNRRAPLDATPVRKALAYLVDDVKRSVAKTMEIDRVELMDSIMVQYYGRLVNRYLPRYETRGAADAVEKTMAQLNGALDGVPDGAIRCLITTDDPTANKIMVELRARIEIVPELARVFTFREVTRNEIAELVYSGEQGDWGLFAGWQYVQDNLSRWNPGMSKLRLSLDWTADFQSGNSRTRNYVGYANPDYDAVASRFLTTLHPRDLRGAVITEEHLAPEWNNADFWEKGGEMPADADALLLLWKLQWMIADDVPLVPLFARSVRFARRADVLGVWNGDPEESFTYSGGSRPIQSSYPGGTMSHWTFQRVRRSDPSIREINLGLSNSLRHVNPLGVGNYWDAIVWSRCFESLLGLNPFLLMKGVAEDAVNLADSFRSELFTSGRTRYGLHFVIKPGIRWHDGTDFTAQDAAFTFLSMLGAAGRDVAGKHPTTRDFGSALVNDTPIPSWVDMACWLDHIEVPDEKSISLFFTRGSRYIHEWFGDMPILPMHVWRHLGNDFTNPSYRGTRGLWAIRDPERRPADGGFSEWHGLVGTGPFVWTPSPDPLTKGGSLTRFEHYHNASPAVEG